MIALVGASPVPTPYRVRAAGIEAFVRCGADILLSGLLVDLEGEGRCPACGGRVRLAVAGGRVEAVEPAGALLHVVEGPGGEGVAVACDGSHLFDGGACLRRWLAAYRGPRGSIWGPRAYLEHLSQRLAPRPAPHPLP